MDSTDDIIQFTRVRDYKLRRELGQGACGKTVLLHDDLIDEVFVCKKYVPFSEHHRQSLFTNFIREIKLLHQVHHRNVVRVFNYYIYPDRFAGYILMEFVDGQNIDQHVRGAPEEINELFVQAIDGFQVLESRKILHRDIRMQNLMVAKDGTLKIIDLGFGKRIQRSEDFGKSISLNLWCEPPNEFADHIYDFRSEVFFLGKLFERLIHDNSIDYFKHSELLGKMCNPDPNQRLGTFAELYQVLQSDRFSEIEFEDHELAPYRRFSDELFEHISRIDMGAQYVDDVELIQTQLNKTYRRIMLEETAPDSSSITRCFVDGAYYYKKAGFPVSVVRDFLRIFTASPPAKKRIILANLHSKLDSIERYSAEPDDDIPF